MNFIKFISTFLKQGARLKIILQNLKKLIKISPFRLLLRLAFNPKSTNKISFGAKFGCSLETGKVLLKKAKELNLNIAGTAFHIGVGCTDFDIYKKALKDCAEIFDCGRALGFTMGK